MDAMLLEAITKAEELRRAHNGIGGVYLYLGHDGDNGCSLKDFDAKEVGKGGSGRSLLEAVERAERDWNHRRALKKAPDQRVGPINEAELVGQCAADAVCSHAMLDKRGVPRTDRSGAVYSLWGRIMAYADMPKEKS